MNQKMIDFARDVMRSGHFNAEQLARRNFCVSALTDFQTAAVKAWDALDEVKEKKLYWPHDSLKEFCRVECGWTDARFYQLASASKVRKSLPPEIQPLVESERQAREIAKVPQEKRAEVVDDAIRFHSKDGSLTVKAIKDSAKRKNPLAGLEDALGMEIPSEALPYWNRRHEIQEMMNLASALKVALENISEKDPLYRRLWPIGGMKKELESIYGSLRGILPSYVCGYCNGVKVENCSGCKGTGLLSVYFDKNLPPEKRANARDRH